MKRFQKKLQKLINLKLSILFITILCTTFTCRAQNSYKNEISFGYCPLGYFFDSSGFRFSSFHKFNSPTLYYKRVLNKRFSLGIAYAESYFNYLPHLKSPFPDNTVLVREQTIISVDLGRRVSKRGFCAEIKAGIRCNIGGYRLMHYFYIYNPSNPWLESYAGGEDHGLIGLKLGASAKHPIIWRFFGEFDAEYSRMLTGADKNQLLICYRLGIKF